MTTYTLTGQITDFGDVAATNVTGTVEAGGLVDGSWVPLSRYVGCDTIMAAACAGYTGISGYSSPLTDPAWQLTTPDTWAGHLSRSGNLIYGDIAAQQIAAALA